MPILATYTKQPADVQDYDIDFASEYLAGLNDAAPGPSGLLVSYEVIIPLPSYSTEDGIFSIESFALNQGIAKVWISGGFDSEKFKVTVTLSTAGGRVKQVEFVVKIIET